MANSSTALMALHAYTGCDTTSAFKGIGKQAPIKLLQRRPEFEAALGRLGNSWDVPDWEFPRDSRSKTTWLDHDKILEPLWCDGDLLPTRLVDVLVDQATKEDSDEVDEDLKVEYWEYDSDSDSDSD